MYNRLVCFATVAVLLAAGAGRAIAQQDGTETKAAAAAEQPAPKHYYRLNFVLRETDKDKVLNQRTFSLDISAEASRARNATPPEWWNVRSGTRVPVSGSQGVNYMDVGVNLDVRAEEVPEGLQMQITSEISSLGTESGLGVANPAIRQLKVRSALLAPIGRPTTVFTADDPASTHRFELEVVSTREK
jgi:hypothetical protein